MRNLKSLFNVILLVTTVFFTSCSDDDESTPKPTPVVTDVTICSDETHTWVVNSTTYNGSEGSQTVFIEGEIGVADQTLNITVTPEPTPVVTDISICSDDTYTWEVNTITYDGSAGTQTVFIEGENCAADQTLNITVTSEPTPVVTDVTICSDEIYTWTVNTITYDGSAGNQMVFIEGADCVADQTLNITVTPEPTPVVTDTTICSYETYTWSVNTTTYDGSAGTQTIFIEGVDCEADQTLNINVTPEPTGIVTDVTICSDETYTWIVNSTTYDGSAGTQTVFIGGTNCEADQTLNITVTPEPTAIVTDVTISSSETYTWSANMITYNGSAGSQTVFFEGVDCAADQTLNITVTVAIGNFVYGGVVFWVDPADNTKGLVCTVIDQNSNAPWGCLGTSIGGTSGTIGTGSANTTAIVAGCTTTGIAAEIASILNLNGYDDWFLPSNGELTEMYTNRVTIGVSAVANGGAVFSDFYWSSSEGSSNVAFAKDFTSGATLIPSKVSTTKVRAVRAF